MDNRRKWNYDQLVWYGTLPNVKLLKIPHPRSSNIHRDNLQWQRCFFYLKRLQYHQSLEKNVDAFSEGKCGGFSLLLTMTVKSWWWWRFRGGEGERGVRRTSASDAFSCLDGAPQIPTIGEYRYRRLTWSNNRAVSSTENGKGSRNSERGQKIKTTSGMLRFCLLFWWVIDCHPTVGIVA